MKQHLFALLTVLFSVNLAVGQQVLKGSSANQKVKGAELVRMNDRNHYPTFIHLQNQHQIPVGELNGWLQKQLKLPNGYHFKFLSKTTDKLGIEHQKYQQYYHNIPVKGGVYIAHIKNGKIQTLNGRIMEVNNLSSFPTLTKEAAISAALKHVNASYYIWQEKEKGKDAHGKTPKDYYPNPTLTIVAKDLKFDKPTFKLAYQMDIYALRPNYRAYVFVDALTGEIIAEENRICYIDVQGTAVTKYSGTKTITTDQVSSTNYRLYESGRGGGIHTKDMNQGTFYSGAVEFTDSDNNWNNVNPQQDEAATDAHYGAEKSYDYFFHEHGRNSYDDAGAVIESYVHYGFSYANAFWNGSVLTYGDGSNSSVLNAPLTTVDICGHELTHGVTEYAAGLIYAQESGALNESFSDLFGVAIDFYADSTSANWRMGEQCSSTGLGIRNMGDPNEFNDPDTYGGNHWYSNGGVHTNSGVQNYWFYLLSVGGSGTNDHGDTYNVTGIGITDAAAIAYRTLSVYLTPSSNYADAQFYGIQSAIDIFGSCSNQVQQTANAWSAVGVGTGVSTSTDFSAEKTLFCSTPAQVGFTNLTFGAQSSLWDFGDGTTDTSTHPIHTYAAPGVYNVTLTTTNCNGVIDSITKINYINVDTSLGICDTTILAVSGIATTTDCSGILVDDGGTNGSHSNGVYSIFTIQPPNVSSITLDFLSLNLESCCDNVRIYDGNSTNTTQIGYYTGSTLPSPITSSGGAITIVFYTDGSVTYDGFVIQWTTQGGTTPPIANFTTPNTLPFNSPIQFTDASSNGGSWLWDFGDGSTSTEQYPIHTFSNSGNYAVSLTTSNCIGSDDTTKIITIQQTPQITITPNNLNVTLFSGDTTTEYLTLTNTGIGDAYHYTSINPIPYSASNTINYTTNGALTTHTFPIQQSPDSVKIKITLNGDYSSSWEYAALYIEGTYIKTLNDYGAYYVDITDSITVSGSQLAVWLADDSLGITIQNSYSVYISNPNMGNYHKVDISYEIIDWLSASNQTGITAPNDSTQIPIHFDAFGMLDGVYQTDISLAINDSLVSEVLIPTTLTVIGAPVIGFSKSTMDFGNVFLNYTASDSLVLHNFGTDTLNVSSISNSLGAYTITPSNATVMPFSSTILYVDFTPTTLGAHPDSIIFINDDQDTLITLAGVGIHPPDVTITPDSLITTLVQGNNTTLDLILNNSGNGPLDYQISIGDEISTILFEGFEDGTYSNFFTNFGSYFYQVNGSNAATGQYGLNIIGGNSNYNDGLSLSINNLTPNEISFNVNSGSNTLSDSYFSLYGNNSIWNSVITFVAHSSGTMGIESGFGTITGIPYNANQWYFVQFKNIDFNTQTYDLYIDQQLIQSNLYLNTYATAISQLHLFNYDFSTAKFDDIHFMSNNGTASWLTTTADSLINTVTAHTIDTLPVQFDANNLATGIYHSSVIVYSNDPDSGTIIVPTKMTVIATPAANFVSSNVVSCDGIVQFTDLSLNIPSSWSWDFGDGNTSTATSPTHTYNTSGIYSVTLITCNAVGCDTLTKQNYVLVDLNGTNCYMTIPLTGIDTSTACSGVLYDDGGPNGNYSNNISSVFSIQPPNATSISIDFPSFNLHNYDYIEIYDGPNTYSNYVGYYSGTNTPPPFTSSGGAVTILFYSYNNTPTAGFEMNWSATGGFIPPITSFTTSNTNPALHTSVQFTNTSFNYGSTFWDFGDGNFSTTNSPSHIYTTPGNYNVLLTANNCAGTDTATQIITVQEAPNLAVTPDSINITLNAGDTSTQYLTIDNTGLGAGQYTTTYTDQPFHETNIEYFIYSGQSSFHSFPFTGPANPSDSVQVKVTLNGDFSSYYEYADIIIEGTFIKQLDDGDSYDGVDVSDSIKIGGVQLASWLTDGLLDITIDNSSSVDVYSNMNNSHKVEISANGIDWMILSPETQTVAVTDSSLYPVFFDATDLISGVYTSEITINTNDLVNPQFNIPTTLTVIGTPSIDFSKATVDFGNVFLNYTANDSIIIYNHGSDVLNITNISNSLGNFTFSNSSFTIPARDSAILYVSFSPTALGNITDSLVLLNNVTDTLIILTGTGVHEPSVMVTPDSLEVTLPVNSTQNEEVYVSNIGLGNLDYTFEKHSFHAIYQEDFERGNHNSLSLENFVSNSHFITSNNPASGQYSLEMISHSYGYQEGLYHNFGISTPNYISFDIRPSTINGIQGHFWLGHNFSTVIDFFCDNWSGEMGIFSPQQYTIPYNANQWYHIEFRNIDYLNHSYDFYIDGQLIQEDITFISSVSNVDEFKIYNSSSDATTYYDNLVIGNQFSGNDVSWVTPTPISGIVTYTNTDTVDVQFNTAGLTPNIYEVDLIVSTNDPDTPQVDVTCLLEVIGVPNTAFSADKAYACSGLVQFWDDTQNGITSWLWDFGDGQTSTEQHPQHTYNASGTYDVKLVTCNSLGCDSLTKQQFIAVDFTNPCDTLLMPTNYSTISHTSCSGVLYDDGGPLGNYSNYTQGRVIIAPTNATNVTLTFQQLALTVNSSAYITIYDGKTTNASILGTFYGGATIPSPITSSGDAIMIEFYTGGYITNAGFKISWECSSPIPTANFIHDGNNTCTNTVNFISFVNNVSTYSWNFGDGTTSSIPNPSHNYSSSGSYEITLTVASNAGISTEVKDSIHINDSPLANFGMPNLAYVNTPVTFTDSSSTNVISWNWNFGNGNTSNLQNPSTLYSSAGQHTITLTVTTADGCVDTYTQNIDVLNNLVVDFTHSGTGTCEQEIHFTNNTLNASNYTWYFGDGDSSNLTNPIHIYSNAGTYNVILVATNSFGLVGHDTSIVTIYELPTADFIHSDTIRKNEPTTFTDNSSPNVVSWNWDFGNGLISTAQNPTIVFTNVGLQDVLLVVTTIEGCVDSLTQTIDVNFPVSTQSLRVADALKVFPNPTTGDLTVVYNFEGQKKLRLTIFNALGQLLHTEQHTTTNGLKTPLSLQHLAEGIYWIRIEDLEDNKPTRQMTTKVLINR